ncbi:MAG: hypothetical protein GKC03_05975 [Methanomassiliicoccales archaeon]|nr:hypothetical protein [Methanomassiliicoccales archaeon]NYT16063.1 hypothetical protein [Methanomassiliicoccales archaeon]
MKSKTLTSLVTVALLLSMIPLSTTLEGANGSDLSITVILTVEGEIQTDDPWTTGSPNINDWAKPMYYIWFDDNGNPDDGRYANGAGPLSAQVNLDTGLLGLRWFGEDRIWGNTDDSVYYPIPAVTPGSEWYCEPNSISASIINDGHSFSITFPLGLIGSPSTLDVSAMASPWTTSALDNTGTGSGIGGWITINDTSVEDVYSLDDPSGESLSWPSELANSALLPNFNIERLEVIIGEGVPTIPTVNIVSTTAPLVYVVGPVVTAEVTNTFEESMDITVNATVYQVSTGTRLHWEDVDITLSSGQSQEVSVEIPMSFMEGVPIQVIWTARYIVSAIPYFATYTDYVITTLDQTVDDSEGYFMIIDNEDDYNSTLAIDWENIAPEFQDSVVSSTDGKVHMMIVNFSAHHSPLGVDLSSAPVVGGIDSESLMNLKGTADTIVGVAAKAAKYESPMMDKLGVVSAGLDLSYVTYRAINCQISGDSCPKDDWEAFDMFVTWTLSAAIVGGTAVALLATSPGWVTGGLAVAAAASAASLAYGSAKLIIPLVKQAIEAEADGEFTPEEGVTYISTQRSVFMEQDPTDYQMSTGFCEVVGSCSNGTADAWIDDFSAELTEKYPDQDLEDWNVTGVNTAPLMNYVDGEPQGTLHFVELQNKETNETTIEPIFIENEGSLQIVYHGEQQEPVLNYEFNYNAMTYSGTMGTPDYVYNSGSQITVEEPGGTTNGDLDLHVYVDDMHIGRNYDTGEIENQVPGAWYSGDLDTAHFTEMVILPANIEDYRIEVDARDAEHATEIYTVDVIVLEDGHIVAELVEEDQIQQGDSKGYDIHIAEDNGEIHIETSTAGDGGDDIWIWIGLIVVVAALAVIVVFVMLRRKRY